MPRRKKSTRGGAQPGAGRKRGGKNSAPVYGAYATLGDEDTSMDSNPEVEAGVDPDAGYDEVAAIEHFLQDGEEREEEHGGIRRSRRTRRATTRVLAALRMDQAAARAAVRAEDRRAARENKASLSQAMSSQTTDDRDSRALTGREWRNRAILRNLRRGHPVNLVSSMYRLKPSTVYDIRRYFLITGNPVPPKKKKRFKFRSATWCKRSVIRRKIQRNPCRSIRGLAVSAGVAFNTARRIVASLGFRYFPQKLLMKEYLIAILASIPDFSFLIAPAKAKKGGWCVGMRHSNLGVKSTQGVEKGRGTRPKGDFFSN